MTSSTVRISACRCQGSEVADHPRVTHVRYGWRMNGPSTVTGSDIRDLQSRQVDPTKDHGAALGSCVSDGEQGEMTTLSAAFYATVPKGDLVSRPIHTTGDRHPGRRRASLYGYPGAREWHLGHELDQATPCTTGEAVELDPTSRNQAPISQLPTNCADRSDVPSNRTTIETLMVEMLIGGNPCMGSSWTFGRSGAATRGRYLPRPWRTRTRACAAETRHE